MATGVPASVQSTPAVSSFGQLKQSVSNYVQGGDSPTELGLAGDAINDGIGFLNSRYWSWELYSLDITTVASTVDYTINADFKHPRKLALLDTSSNEASWLNWCDNKRFMDVYYSNTFEGNPEAYTVFNSVSLQTLSLNRTPDASWVALYPTMRLWYFSRIQKLVDNADVLVAPHEVETFLVWYGRWTMAAVYDTAGAAKIDRAFAMWNRMHRDLIGAENDTNTDYLD